MVQPSAPVIIHILLLFPKRIRLSTMLGAAPSNTHRLRWFHSIHAPKIIKEFSPFLVRTDVVMCNFSHHPSKIRSLGSGAREWRPTCLRTRYQNCLAKTQATSRWSMVSSSWSHSGHFSGWSRPRRAKRSAVQHLLWATSHMNILHFRDAQDFQILSQGRNSVAPKSRLS
jgi:hypothetical protein